MSYDWPVGPLEAEDDDDAIARERHEEDRRLVLHPDPSRAALRAAAPAEAATSAREQWLPLGPSTVVGGQANGRTRVSGRVRALAVHPDGSRLYAAAANGGVWYSGDEGRRWSPIGALAPTVRPEVTRPAHRHAIGAVLVTNWGVDAAGDEVYIGTGEINRGPVPHPPLKLGGIGVLHAIGPAAVAVDQDPWRREAPQLVGEAVHRLALDPVRAVVYAATSVGLLARPAAGGLGVAWAPVAGGPAGSCTEVLWTRGDGARPARLWVWQAAGAGAGLHVREGDGAFRPVATPGTIARRAALAAAEPPARLYLFNDRFVPAPGVAQPPLLLSIDNSGAALPAATPVVDGVPDVLRRQGSYDMAIAVDPADPGRVVLGGQTLQARTPAGTDFEVSDAAIVTGTVAVRGGRLTYGDVVNIGVGAHADVHDLRFTGGGARLWTACDGGVYRSDRPRDQVGFVPCNDGLEVVQPNFLASHPACEGFLVGGLQDNGVIEPASTGTWRHRGDGDCGGIAFDPASPSRYVRQFHSAHWTSTDGTTGFSTFLRRGAGATSDDRRNEEGAAAFYAQPAAIAEVRDGRTVVQALIATDRLWLTEDWGRTWVTLPTATDPIRAHTYNRGQDRLSHGTGIRVCRWATPSVAWTMNQGLVTRFERTSRAGARGTWTHLELLDQRIADPADFTAAQGPLRATPGFTDLAVDLRADGTARGAFGSVYLGTAGHPTTAGCDTLWWFDGATTWWPTGLRAAVPAPVTAVLTDPARVDEVYVGTTIGVWRGVRRPLPAALSPATPPRWDWAAPPLVNGLPEAVVQDLSLVAVGAARLLRAGVTARGVWELELEADVRPRTYLRAHDDDTRRRDRAVAVGRDGRTARSWHGSPDVRPRVRTAAIARPSTLPWRRTSAAVRPEALRRFQAALRSARGDERVRATGVWDLHFDEILRSLGAPVVGGQVRIDAAFWDAAMTPPHAVAEPWGAAGPTETDLIELTPALPEGALRRASCRLPPAPLDVDVVVHHRGPQAVAGDELRVVLLRWLDPAARGRARFDDVRTWPGVRPAGAGLPPESAPFRAAVQDILNTPGGTTANALGAGWELADAATPRRTAAGSFVGPGAPAVVTFRADLTGVRRDALALLVAVVRGAEDVALADVPLPELVATHPGVAVRSVRVRA